MPSRKQNIIQHLRDAKQGHVRWVMYASALIGGLEVAKDHVPVSGTDCSFGKWYYTDGQMLKALPSFKKIEQPHLELHKAYMEIFRLLFNSDNREEVGFWGRLFGRKSERQSEEQRQKVQTQFLLLQNLSRAIVDLLDSLEDEVALLSDKEVENLY